MRYTGSDQSSSRNKGNSSFFRNEQKVAGKIRGGRRQLGRLKEVYNESLCRTSVTVVLRLLIHVVTPRLHVRCQAKVKRDQSETGSAKRQNRASIPQLGRSCRYSQFRLSTFKIGEMFGRMGGTSANGEDGSRHLPARYFERLFRHWSKKIRKVS